MDKTKDEFFIRKAMILALKAKGKTSPNPLVGAVVVKDNRIVGEGFHKKAGGPHAEIFALNEAGKKAKGATIYVTLEPCCHFGRTPPCVDAIIKSGIKEVVIGMKDPNSLNNGKGIKILKKHNIKVRAGFLEAPLKDMNEAFIKYITKKMPFVTVKVGQSLDGKIATRTGDSKWITSEASRKYARRLRNFNDAIMIGANTAAGDNPLLNRSFKPGDFFKIIIDPELKINLDSKILSKNSKGKVLIAAAKNASKTKIQQLENKGVCVLSFPINKGRIILKELMKQLVIREITSILVEGGGNLIGPLFDEKLVDKVMFFVAPKIIGGKDAVSSVEGRGVARINGIIELENVSLKKIGGDFLMEGEVV